MVIAPARRQQVAYATKRGLSTRRACALLSVARSALHYESRLRQKDAPALAAMSILSAQYPRYGYRRIHVFLERQGHRMSIDRAWRLWRNAGLQVPKKRSHKRVACGRPRPQAPMAARQVWAYDFVFDACANGQQIKCLTVIDEFTRESLAIDVAGSIRSGRVIEVLSQLISLHGAPKILRWASGQNLDMALIDPGKPWQNGTTESFNGKFRDECLSMEWFRNRIEAKVVIEQWRRHYNEIRPHSSLGNQTPAAFKKSCSSTTQPRAVFQE